MFAQDTALSKEKARNTNPALWAHHLVMVTDQIIASTLLLGAQQGAEQGLLSLGTNKK
jgi:hypothetical protein